MPLPLAIAVAVGDQYEGLLCARIEGDGLRVAGRSCQVAQFYGSVRQVEAALSDGEQDILVVSSTLNAVPFDRLRGWAEIGRRLVVCAPDPTAERWVEFPCPVIALSATADELALALEHALNGRPARRSSPAHRRARHRAAATTPEPATPSRGQILTVCSAEDPLGKTTFAVSLAVALSLAGGTVLVDANERGSGVEYHLAGLKPRAGNIAEAARANPGSAESWREAVMTQLQPMGAPASAEGQVLCGAFRPSLRQWLTAEVLSSVLDVCQDRFPFTVLDTSGAGWALGDPGAAQLALKRADRLLMLVRPDAQGVDRAERLLHRWPHRDRVQLVLNQVGLAGQVPASDVEVRLGAPIVASLPFDATGVARARTRQRPVVCEPGCKVSRPLLELAERIAEGKSLRVAVDQPATSQPPWWRRLGFAFASVVR
jgi:MinD-like ATPase involved in chromosome partitioning or flagellar assembly